MSDDDIYKFPTTPQIARDNLRWKIGENELPYVVASKRQLNFFIDEMAKNVWPHLCDNSGKLPSGKVPETITQCMEGLNAKSFEKVKEHIPRATDEQLKFWIDFLKQPIEELFPQRVIAKTGLDIISNELRYRSTEQKLEKVFTGNDMNDWIKHANRNKLLFTNTGNLPIENFSFEEFQVFVQKVQAMLTTTVKW